MEVRYRLAQPSDAEAVARLQVRSWQAAYAGLLDADKLWALDPGERVEMYQRGFDRFYAQQRGLVTVVATVDDTPVGFASVRRDDDADQTASGTMHMLNLDPDYWRQGIGTVLNDMAMRGLRRLGCDTGRLWVLDGNERAIDFYETQGWKLTGQSQTDEMWGMTVFEHEMKRPVAVDLLDTNRGYWNDQARDYAAHTQWSDEITWGIFGVPDQGRFPDVAGKDVVELGCGTAYVSGWAAARGAATVTGLDNSPAQLATARRFASEAGTDLGLVFGDAHRLPFADDSFDVAINEYGAAIWCDPRVWIPEAARVLRPGGTLWFLGNSVQMSLCANEIEDVLATAEMQRPQRAMHRTSWLDTDGIEFHVSHGEMISILTGAGFRVEALHELYCDPDSDTRYGFVDAWWASRWPVEEIWVAQLHP